MAADYSGPLTLGRAVDLFLAGKAACERGAAAKTISWYRMILTRLVRSAVLTSGHSLDPGALRAWVVELRSTLAPVSVAGYVRTLKVFGNWLVAEGFGELPGLRDLRRPRVPHKLIEPVGDDVLRRLRAIASVRDRAILLLLLDTGLRVSEAAGRRLGDLQADGTVKVRVAGPDPPCGTA